MKIDDGRARVTCLCTLHVTPLALAFLAFFGLLNVAVVASYYWAGWVVI